MKTERRRSNRQPPSTRSRGRLSFSSVREKFVATAGRRLLCRSHEEDTTIRTPPLRVCELLAMRGASSRALLQLSPRARSSRSARCPFALHEWKDVGILTVKVWFAVAAAAAAAAALTTSGGFKDSPVCWNVGLALVCVCAREAPPGPFIQGAFYYKLRPRTTSSRYRAPIIIDRRAFYRDASTENERERKKNRGFLFFLGRKGGTR